VHHFPCQKPARFSNGSPGWLDHAAWPLRIDWLKLKPLRFKAIVLTPRAVTDATTAAGGEQEVQLRAVVERGRMEDQNDRSSPWAATMFVGSSLGRTCSRSSGSRFGRPTHQGAGDE